MSKQGEERYNAMRPVVLLGVVALVAVAIYVIVADKWRINANEDDVRSALLENADSDDLRKYDDIVANMTTKNNRQSEQRQLGNQLDGLHQNSQLAQNQQMSQNRDSVSNLKFGDNSKDSSKDDLVASSDNNNDNDNGESDNNSEINKEKDMTDSNLVTTDSGLQYEVLVMGDGAKPTLSNEVTVHYHGTLLDGTVFDSSVQRGEKISFPLGGVIAGWQEGLQLMPVGSKFKFTIPSELAYGDRATGKIPANSTLIFEVELFEVK